MKIGYHVTLARNLNQIMAHGLVPRIGPRSKKLGERQAAIYFLPSLQHVEDAIGNWLGGEFSEDTKLALLCVEIPDDVPVASSADFEFHVNEPIPPHCIRIMTRDVGNEISIGEL